MGTGITIAGREPNKSAIIALFFDKIDIFPTIYLKYGILYRLFIHLHQMNCPGEL